MARTVISTPCAECQKVVYREPRKLNPGQENVFCNRHCWSDWKRKNLPLDFQKTGTEKNAENAVSRRKQRTKSYECDYCKKSFSRDTKWGPRLGTYCSRVCAALGNEGVRWTGYKNDSRTRQSFQQAVRRRFIDECAICRWDEAHCDIHHIVAPIEGGLHAFTNIVFLCPNHHRLAHRRKISTYELTRAQENMKRRPGVPDKAFL